METQVDLISIYATNFLGILLLLLQLVNNRWRLKEKDKENRIIIAILFCTMISCLADPLIFWVDGKSGIVCRLIVYIGNTWLYIANITNSVLFVIFLENHLLGRVSKKHARVLWALTLIGGTLLITNFFAPIVFDVNENNVYERGPLYLIYIVFTLAIMVASILEYFYIRRCGGILKFFPIWAFILPLSLGLCIQSMVYGVSLIWPCAAISLTGVISGLQNEMIFRDKLTGLYNCYYLDNLANEMSKLKNSIFTILMFDLNSFKSINDEYGHLVGDNALVEASKILLHETYNLGSVIRYAGDEFVAVINVSDEKQIQHYLSRIHQKLEEFNNTTNKPYSLSVSIGYKVADLKDRQIEDVLNEVDKKMYADKALFYQTHPNSNRRSI